MFCASLRAPNRLKPQLSITDEKISKKKKKMFGVDCTIDTGAGQVGTTARKKRLKQHRRLKTRQRSAAERGGSDVQVGHRLCQRSTSFSSQNMMIRAIVMAMMTIFEAPPVTVTVTQVLIVSLICRYRRQLG